MRGLMAAMAALLGLAMPAMAACPSLPPGRPLPREAMPIALEHPEWRPLVDGVTARLGQTNLAAVRLVFLGDSITQSWQPNIFEQFYGSRAALNLGVSGDGTQGVLWRLENGGWPAALQPEAIVLLIGTNNIGAGARAENVALGIAQIVARLQRLAPNARILLLGVLPRGATAADPTRPVIARVNQFIAPCADGRRVLYADPGQMMVDAAGNLADWVAFDRLHLSLVGYAILSAGIEAPLRLALQR